MESITRIVDAIVNIHPPHATAVHFPIALTAVALLLALWQRDDALQQAASFNITLAAVVAGLTGYRRVGHSICRLSAPDKRLPYRTNRSR